MKTHLLILGIAFIIFGICFILTFLKEKTKKYSLVQGKIIKILKRHSQSGKGFSYTPIIEYQYNGSTYKTEHRISSPNLNLTYDINDRVELRVYENKPDKAIINNKKNLFAPLIIGITVLIIGGILLFVSYFILK